MLRKQKNLLITDLDNTLFNWFDIWYYPFKAMLEKTVEITQIPKDRLIEEIREVHQKHGTAEYAFVLEELPSVLEKYGDRKTILTALDGAIYAHRKARKEHLKLYDGVQETLSKIKNSGATVVAYTESTEWYSKFRISRLGLDGLIDVLYSPEDHHVPITKAERRPINLLKTKCRNTPRGELKPNPQLLIDIIKDEGRSRDQSVYIGDSEFKDIEMAINANVDNVFAEYGTDHFKKDDDRYELLRSVTHWTEADVRREKEIKDNSTGARPTMVAKRFSDLLEYFEFRGHK